MAGTLDELEQYEAFIRADNDDEVIKFQRARAESRSKHNTLRTKIRTN